MVVKRNFCVQLSVNEILSTRRGFVNTKKLKGAFVGHIVYKTEEYSPLAYSQHLLFPSLLYLTLSSHVIILNMG